MGGIQEDLLSAEKFDRYKTEVEGRIKKKEGLAPRNKVKSEKR